jgi:hypothetical protein
MYGHVFGNIGERYREQFWTSILDRPEESKALSMVVFSFSEVGWLGV